MSKKRKHPKKSRLRIDPYSLSVAMYNKRLVLSELKALAKLDPVEFEILYDLDRPKKIHLDTLNRIAAALEVPPNDLLLPQCCPNSIEFVCVTDYSDNLFEE